MAEWSKTKVDANDINNGNEYERKDRPTRQQLNAIVNNSLYASQISENVASQLSNLNPEDKIEFKGSNPNLLINGDFRINQRGKTSYSTAGEYTVDRWKLVSGSVNVVSNGITLNGTITQTLESIPTQTLTVSCSNNNATIEYFDGVVTITATNQLIEWAKLEVGLVKTAFSPRPYAEKLALCQRYYRRYGSTSSSTKLLGLCLSNGSIGFLPLMLDIPFRTAPTVNYNGVSIYNGVAGGNINITSMRVSAVSPLNNNLYLEIAFSGEATRIYALRLNQGESNYLELDAEIY